jgi:hypothetical protein
MRQEADLSIAKFESDLKPVRTKEAPVPRTSNKPAQVQKPKRSNAREWTAVEKFRLKGLAKQAHSAEKIARMLGRPVDATVAMASKLSVSLKVMDLSTPDLVAHRQP